MSTIVFFLVFIEKTIEIFLFRRLLIQFDCLAAKKKNRELMADIPQNNVIVIDVSSRNSSTIAKEKHKFDESDDDVKYLFFSKKINF